MVGKGSRLERICASDAFTTFVVCTAIFSDMFVYDLIIPFIPQMLEHRLGLPREQVQLWTSTLLGVFGAFFGAGNILAGFLTDYCKSKRTPFLFGMILMLASSLMFFLGEHIAITITARALQGLSASFVWVSGLAFLNSRIKADYVGAAMTYVSVAMGAGELIGPIVGGAMYEHTGHFAVLGLVCGILGVDILLRIALMEEPSEPRRETATGQDNQEQPLLDGEREALIHRPANTQDTTKTRYINIFGFQLESDLCASLYAAIVIGTIRYAFESALVVFVSQRFSWSTSASGGIVFAFCSPAVLGPLIGHYTTKYGPRWISVAAFVIKAVSLVALGFLTHNDKATKVLFVVAIIVIGICLSLLSTVQSIAFSVAAKSREMKAKQEGRDESSGIAFGGYSFAWAVGMFVGPLAAEVFVDHVNWLGFCIFLAGLSVVSSIVMSFTWREWDVSDEQE
ncbi:hypothetical protein E2P81_ATG01518 [Venturia nashicola]|uniref:Major facilitator superfamily (MFS) profile domain-containing protein n=1 Tax=Venturia nashicola TaxID=86259 RepID=A0A4Z1PSE1_9PEZI|nr:hypothetical protein E6O75_ATG01558 [Venturia nashicola]TLD38975.1 hypothetical protein E2P81_ATG01518 [Venturia nashicola]